MSKRGGRPVMLLFMIVVILIVAVRVVWELAGRELSGGGLEPLAPFIGPFATLIVVIVFGMLGELKKVELNIGRGGSP